MKYILWFKQSKTMIWAACLAALGAAQSSMGLFTAILTPQTYGLIMLGISVVTAVLRIVTTKPLEGISK